MKEKIEKLTVKLKTIKNKIVYKIQKKMCDLLYRRQTYISEKGLWVCTVVFPKDIIFNDGEDKATICGITDVFKGNEKGKIEDPLPIYSEYINRRPDARAIHKSVIEEMKTGYIAILGSKMEVEI